MRHIFSILFILSFFIFPACSNGPMPHQTAYELHACTPDQPVVVLKVDDLEGHNSRWTRFIQHILDNPRLTADIGIITSSLVNGSSDYLEDIQELAQTPRLQFWHHGWDHKLIWVEDGIAACEFDLYDHDTQVRHLRWGFEAAQNLGFELNGFGAPCNDLGPTTGQALDEVELTGWWYYGPAEDPRSLVRGAVRLEAGVGKPDLAALQASFDPEAIHPQVIQLHPAGWDDDRWEVVVEALDWLLDQGACFMNARDLE